MTVVRANPRIAAWLKEYFKSENGDTPFEIVEDGSIHEAQLLDGDESVIGLWEVAERLNEKTARCRCRYKSSFLHEGAVFLLRAEGGASAWVSDFFRDVNCRAGMLYNVRALHLLMERHGLPAVMKYHHNTIDIIAYDQAAIDAVKRELGGRAEVTGTLITPERIGETLKWFGFMTKLPAPLISPPR